jgi:DNA polymerase
MTAKEKTVLANFLDLTGDFLRDGHMRNRADYSFTDDDEEHKEKDAVKADVKQEVRTEDFSSLPLAYQVEEEEAETGDKLRELSASIGSCKACGLGATRTLPVPGEGAENPLVMVIGEGPGADEDAAGRPFVGKAGQLLDRMLSSIGLYRDKDCYIANMVKCRPPGNRDPSPEEISACLPFLKQQIELLRPRLILCAGRVAAQNLLRTSEGINSLRGRFTEYRLHDSANNETDILIPVLPTFHPSAILRDETLKRPAWEDLKLLRSRLISLDSEYAAGEA